MTIIKTHNRIFIVDEINYANLYEEMVEIHYQNGKEYGAYFDGITIKERKEQARVFFAELIDKMEKVAKEKEAVINV